MTGIIYRITNKANGKVYIGQSYQKDNIRIKRHFRRLRNNRHPNLRMQEDFNQFSDDFDWEILGSYAIAELDRMEKFHIENERAMESMFGYNQIYGKRSLRKEKHVSELEFEQVKEELQAYKRIVQHKDLQLEQLRLRIEELEARTVKYDPVLFDHAVAYLQRYYDLNKDDGITYIHSSFVQTMLKNKAAALGAKFSDWTPIRDALIDAGWIQFSKDRSPMFHLGAKLVPHSAVEESSE